MKNLKTLVLVVACNLLFSVSLCAQSVVVDDKFNTISPDWQTFGNPSFTSVTFSGNPALELGITPNGNVQGGNRPLTGAGPWSAQVSFFSSGYLFNPSTPLEFRILVGLGNVGRQAGIIFINDGLSSAFYGINTAAGSLQPILTFPNDTFPQGADWRTLAITNDGTGNISYSIAGSELMTTFYGGDSSPISVQLAGVNYGNALNGVYMDNLLVITTVPEPSTYALIGLVAIALLASKRLRSRSAAAGASI